MKVKYFIKLLFSLVFWKAIIELFYTFYVLKFRKYYTHIDYLPLCNFAEIMKGRFNYLYVGYKNRRVPIGAFSKIFEQMNYQFKVLDNSRLRDKAALADYDSAYVRTGNKRWLNEYNTLKKQIDDSDTNLFDLDEFTQYIELSFNNPISSLDINMSTSRAFLAYQKAIAHNKKLRNGNN